MESRIGNNNIYNQTEEFRSAYLLRPDSDNLRCFDCKSDREVPVWASVNNGILICHDCISLHRALGNPQISLVRSTQLDIWTEN